MKELRHYAHCVSQNTYHLEWATKYRDDRFGSLYRRKLCEGCLRMAALRHGIRVISLRVLIDHIHMFVELRPSMAPAKAVNLLKGISSRMIRKYIKHLAKEKCLWSPGKFVRSVGNVTSQTIDRYIRFSSKNQYSQQQTINGWA